MGRFKGQKIEKREDKERRINSAIANMEIGYIATPTHLARDLSRTQPGFLIDHLNSLDTGKQIIPMFNIVRDNKGEIRFGIRIDENSNAKDLEIKEELLKINSKLDKIKESIKSKK